MNVEEKRAVWEQARRMSFENFDAFLIEIIAETMRLERISVFNELVSVYTSDARRQARGNTCAASYLPLIEAGVTFEEFAPMLHKIVREIEGIARIEERARCSEECRRQMNDQKNKSMPGHLVASQCMLGIGALK